MFAWQATVQDEAGNAVPLPVVTVWESDGVTLASIFDEAGVALLNPLTGTMEGFVQFWADAGDYKIEGAGGPESTEVWSVSLGRANIVKDAPAFFALTSTPVGRYSSQDGLAWDVLAVGPGDFPHPVTGDPVSVPIVNGARAAEAFGQIIGSPDAYLAIQGAFDALPAASVELPLGQIFTSQTINNNGRAWISSAETIISPAVSADLVSVLEVYGQGRDFDPLYIQCAGRADRGVSFVGANGSILQNVRIEGYRVDGIRFELTGNNNNLLVDGALIRNGGTYHSAGTLTGALNATSVTISGAGIDLTTLPEINQGRGWLWYDGAPYEIISATASGLTIYPGLATAASGAAYSIEIGAGITVLPQGNNSEIRVERLNAQSTPCGLDDIGLFGVKGRNNLYQTVSIGRAINRYHRTGALTRAPTDDDVYHEVTRCTFYVGRASFFRAVGGNDDMISSVIVRPASSGTDIRRGRGMGAVQQAVVVNSTGAVVPPIGGIIQMIGAPAKSVNLPEAPSDPATRLLWGMTCQITVGAQGAAGNTTIRTTDGSTIMGVAGATGAVIRGSRRIITATFNPQQNDWYLDIPPLKGRYNASSGLAASGEYTLAISGFNANTAALLVSVSGEGAGVLGHSMTYKITDKTDAGCNIVARNGGASAQLFSISWAVIE